MKELDLVVLTHDIPEYGLLQGDLGTIVHGYTDGQAWEVEFVTAEGRTVACPRCDRGVRSGCAAAGVRRLAGAGRLTLTYATSTPVVGSSGLVRALRRAEGRAPSLDRRHPVRGASKPGRRLIRPS
jgi:hypothetical protein